MAAFRILISLLFLINISHYGFAQSLTEIQVTGTVLDTQSRAVPNAVVKVTDGLGRVKQKSVANAEGKYSIKVLGNSPFALVAEAIGFDPATTVLMEMKNEAIIVDLKFGTLTKAEAVLTITEKVIEPTVDQRDAALFTKTLFTRDDQIFQTLGAGLSLGQHAGGGKSLEVRRFGFNLDHGGVGGGLKVMLDDMMLNLPSGGHAHGYLGALKGLSPELVESVNLINGPFNAQYGDFSGLGVVNIKTREDMPDQLTGRVQFGQFNTRRVFTAYSPSFKNTNYLIANEYSYSDGPFLNPLRYLRDNITLGVFHTIRPGEKFGFRALGALNDFYSAGQLPVDLIEQGKLDRFGYIDPTDGGKVKTGTVTGFYSKQRANGDTIQVNGMVQRLLFDLFSNFTFFLDDPINGDGFGQHDSRLQEGLNFSYQKPHQVLGGVGNLVFGANYLDNQINLTLYGRIGRVPTDLRTAANNRTANTAQFIQETLTLMKGKVQIGLGLRYDNFNFAATDRLDKSVNIKINQGLLQPKASLTYTPWLGKPLAFHWNYGRSVTSSNARALIIDPASALVAKTDFFQFGTSHNKGRFSAATSFFWIDRSFETIYVADSGLNEFTGPSRNYGFELKTSTQINPYLSLNASLTKVINSFYRGTSPREYIDRAPHFTGYVGLTLSQWKGWSGSARLRAINRYILNGSEGSGQSRVPGHTVTDIGFSRKIWKGVELNIAVDNIFNKTYYETFEKYESALRGEDPIERVHATPGYGTTFVGGLTFRLFNKAR